MLFTLYATVCANTTAVAASSHNEMQMRLGRAITHTQCSQLMTIAIIPLLHTAALTPLLLTSRTSSMAV